MIRIFMTIVVGFSCFVMMSCSTTSYHYRNNETSESIFVDNNDGTFTDKRNLIQWTKVDSTPGPGYCYGGNEKNYFFMQWHLDCLNRNKYLGYNDWRMPTYEELENLRNTPKKEVSSFLNPQVHEKLNQHAYWSTTDMAIFIYEQGTMIYNIVGPVYRYNMTSSYYVWPVRALNEMKLIASSR